MQVPARKRVRYDKGLKHAVIYAVMRDGFSISSICMQYGIDHPYTVREWIREEMKKRNLVRIPRTLVKRGRAPMVLISEPIERQFKQYEEIIMYQQCMIEALYAEGNAEIKKKLLSMLPPKQRRSLKKTGKLST